MFLVFFYWIKSVEHWVIVDVVFQYQITHSGFALIAKNLLMFNKRKYLGKTISYDRENPLS
jgi:hypothetical protein